MENKKKKEIGLTPETNEIKRNDVNSLKKSFVNHLEYTLAKNSHTATEMDKFFSIAHTIRDRLVEKRTETLNTYYREKPKKIYYLSLEFLIGRADGLQFNLNGQSLPGLGSDSSVVRYLKVDSTGIAAKVIKAD